MHTTTTETLRAEVASLKALQSTQIGTAAWDATQAQIVAVEDRLYDLAGSHTWNTSKCK